MPNLPLHPAIVHVPLGLAFVMPLVGAGLAVALWRGLVPRRAWALAVVLQALLVAGGWAASWAGHRDERQVERIVGEPAIERHEEAAEALLWGATVTLVLAAGALLLPARATVAAAGAAALGMAVVAGLAVRAGHAGGELVYARGGAAAYADPAATAPGPGGPRVAGRSHDD